MKEIRFRNRIGLREFCMTHGHDPSNWSKIERGILNPPKDDEMLAEWASQLGIEPGSADWHKFHDLAAIQGGRIPKYILDEPEIVSKLPAFFRTLSGQKPSKEDLEKLLAIIRQTQQP